MAKQMRDPRKAGQPSRAEKRSAGSKAARRPKAQQERVVYYKEPSSSRGLYVLGGIMVVLLVVVAGLLIYDMTSSGEGGGGQQAGGGIDLRELERVAAANPNDLSALLQLGHAYLDTAQAQGAAPQQRDELFRKATDTYTKAQSIQPNNADVVTHLGNLDYYYGRTDEALKKYDQALAQNPTYAHAMFDKASALRFGKNDYAGAIAVWEQFLKLVPADSPDAANVQRMIEEAKQATESRTTTTTP